MDAQAIPAQSAQCGRAALDTAKLSAIPPAIAVAVAAIVGTAIQALWLPIDADVSWLITVCERVLAGDRLYVDIFEVNPPASVWLYLGLVWLADMLGARPEAVVVAAFIAAACASVAATLGLASRLRDAPPPLLLAGILSFVALVLPMALFAQREHAALLLALPALAAMAVVAEGKPIARPALYASGFAAGLVIVIKPYFLLAVILPALWAAYRRRSPAPLVPGIAAGAAAIAFYSAALIAFAGDYFQWLPVIVQTYAPMHEQWWKVMVGPAIYPAICLALVFLLRPPRVPSLTMVWALGAAGFLAAAVVQGKNYPNHWFPQAGLALAAVFAVLPLRGVERGRAAAVAAALAVVSLSLMHFWIIRPDPAVARAIERLAPPAPKIIALSPQLTTGHPVTRNVGGTWAASRPALFIAAGARFVGLDGAVATRAYRDDIRSFAIDVRQSAPDVVLVHKPSKEWLMREQVIARAMEPYAPAAAAGDIEIWVRRGGSR